MDRGPERHALAPLREHLEGVVDRLDQHLISPGENRRDHVHDLGDVRDLDAVGVADEAVQEARDHQRVFEIVDLLDEMSRELALRVHPLAVEGLVPDVPLVEAEIGTFRRLALPLHEAADGVHLLDLLIDAVGHGEEIGRVVGAVIHVAVEAHVVRQVAEVLEHHAVPLQVGGQDRPAGTARDQLDGWVHALHQLPRLLGAQRVLLGGHLAELPGTVHLVAETPER